MPADSFAATYWVAPSGAATWENCSGDTPLSGITACSLTTANANVIAGDTVYLRGGTYTTHIFPARSGSGANARISYRGYADENVVIRNTTSAYATYYHGIALISRNYIWVDRVTVNNPVGAVPTGKDRPFMITHGSSYNELSACEINGNGSGAIQMWRGTINGVPVTHNWIHGCYIHSIGGLYWNGSYVDDGGGMQLGVPSYDDASGNNTIENNVFACGGHHNLETFTKNNVIRNNFFRNEGCLRNTTGQKPVYGPDTNSLWGNRNLQVYDGHDSDGTFNLVEGNRFGPSGPPPDDDGGDGLTITAPKNIIRYNEIYGSQNNGLLMKVGAQSHSDSNRVYNNTISGAGRFHNAGPLWQAAGVRFYGSLTPSSGNVFQNNIIHSPLGNVDILHDNHGGGTEGVNTFQNNLCTSAVKAGQATACIGYGDPKFIDGSLSIFAPSQLKPNFELRSDSPALNAGERLTSAIGSGTNSTTLIVADSLYFQDGSWGSALARHQSDWISIGSVSNAVGIARINYSSNTIILATATTWASGDPVWLYKKADGVRVLYGQAPDIGAHEIVSADPPRPPSRLRVVR